MNTILSGFYFNVRAFEMEPGIELGVTFDALVSVLDTVAVYQEQAMIKGFDPFTIALLFFRPLEETADE